MTTKQMIVVLGLDEQKKPHAAKFDLAQAEAVRKAARLMEFRIALPKSEEAVALADRLPPGKLFATGKGLVPYCKADSYQKLVDVLEMEPEGAKDTPVAAKPAPTPAKAASGDLWADLKIGDKVIAPEARPAEDGYWPAVITATSKDRLTVRWLDNPKQPPASVKRRAVALLPG